MVSRKRIQGITSAEQTRYDLHGKPTGFENWSTADLMMHRTTYGGEDYLAMGEELRRRDERRRMTSRHYGVF